MKRLTSLLLTALMILSALPMMSFAGRFEDVTDGKWYSEGIGFCAANEYMTGTSEGYFDRNGTLTRAMFITILAKVDGADLSAYKDKSSFRDVRINAWYSQAIEWAYQNKVTAGLSDTEFGYKNPVTREQIALLLYAYSEYRNNCILEASGGDAEAVKDQLIDLELRTDISDFADYNRVHQFAHEAMSWAVAGELISGISETHLDPRGNCTRAQTSLIIRKYVLTFLSDCEHEWSEPTCIEMSLCTKCGIANATELGHDFDDRPCNETVKCSRCDEISPAKEHSFTKANCTEPSVCLNCGIENAPANGHKMLAATYSQPSRCSVCGYTTGEPIAHEHDFVGASCEGVGICRLCRSTCPALGHTTSNGYCSRENCGAPVFATAHNKLVYHINVYGTKEGVYKYLSWMDVEMALIPGEPTVYIIYEDTDHQSGLTFRIELILPDSISKTYDFYSYCYDENGYYYAVSGTISTDISNNGEFMLTGYSGDEGIRDVALGLTCNYLPKMLKEWSSTMSHYCGIWNSDYGFGS